MHKKIVGTAGLATALAGSALAQDSGAPAVKNINAKLSFGYADTNGTDQANGPFLSAAISFPVTDPIGVQVDFGLDNLTNDSRSVDGSKAIGIHVFTRDPSTFLIGAYAHYIETDTATLGTARSVRYGVEGEYYFENFTVDGFLGRDEVRFSGTDQSFTAVEFSTSYFINDNFKLTGSFNHAFDNNRGEFGVEYLANISGQPFAWFATVGRENGNTSVVAGATIYFGNNGLSLKQIERQNDPKIRFAGAVRSFSQFTEEAAREILGRPTGVCSYYICKKT